ncbi:glucohydrolase, partial [Acinetobacter sp. RIT592]
LDDSKFLVITNMSNDNVLYNYDEIKLNYRNLILSNIEVKEHDIISSINLKPWECRLYKI